MSHLLKNSESYTKTFYCYLSNDLCLGITETIIIPLTLQKNLLTLVQLQEGSLKFFLSLSPIHSPCKTTDAFLLG